MSDLNAYFEASTGDWPAPGVGGVVGGWLHAGRWRAPTGPILAGDPGVPVTESVLFEDLVAGDYDVAVRGIDFDGHRRVAAVRLVRAGVDPDTLSPGEAATEAQVDFGLFGFLDLGELDRVVPEMHPEHDRLAKAFMDETLDMPNGFTIGLVTYELGRHTKRGARDDLHFWAVEPGLGDGSYPVWPLVDGDGRVRGAEAVFLEEGQTADADVPDFDAARDDDEQAR